MADPKEQVATMWGTVHQDLPEPSTRVDREHFVKCAMAYHLPVDADDEKKVLVWKWWRGRFDGAHGQDRRRGRVAIRHARLSSSTKQRAKILTSRERTGTKRMACHYFFVGFGCRFRVACGTLWIVDCGLWVVG